MRTHQKEMLRCIRPLRGDRSAALAKVRWIGVRGCLPYPCVSGRTDELEGRGTGTPGLLRLPRGGRILASGSMRSPP